MARSARSKMAARGFVAAAVWMAVLGLRSSTFVPEALPRRELVASAMLAALAGGSLPDRAEAQYAPGKNRINSLSLENDIAAGNFEGYDLKGTSDRLGSKLTNNYDKVKPICEEVSVSVQGGSRTSMDDATKRYLCDRTDLKKQKEEAGQYSYTKNAKEIEDTKLEEMRKERQAEKEARLKMFRRPRDQIVTK
ncbi:unnamed protein product [Durusdinium trenchii]|uniref:Uncharacterized protein n=1 Tax=Durusdinium trenchii TaxID=1381693 RepID=A0ABP0RZP9_9DINO